MPIGFLLPFVRRSPPYSVLSLLARTRYFSIRQGSFHPICILFSAPLFFPLFRFFPPISPGSGPHVQSFDLVCWHFCLQCDPQSPCRLATFSPSCCQWWVPGLCLPPLRSPYSQACFLESSFSSRPPVGPVHDIGPTWFFPPVLGRDRLPLPLPFNVRLPGSLTV